MSDLTSRIHHLLEASGAAVPPDVASALCDLLSTELTAFTASSVVADHPTTWAPSTEPAELDAERVPTDQVASFDERYELLGLLGAGGMGTVYRAHDKVLRRVVALKISRKVVADPAGSRFLQEAQTAAQLEHPGVVPIYDFGVLDNGRLYTTMQVVQGRSLARSVHELHRARHDDVWQATRGGDTLRRLVGALHQVSEAMAYAHHRGVIHRDLKPANIMLGAYGEAIVVDWGLAKVVDRPDVAADAGAPGVSTDRGDDDSMSTRDGSMAGTLVYMSPEQARGEVSRLGPQADVWALGAILYELLAGVPPFPGDSAVELFRAVTCGEPPDPPQVVSGRPVPADLSALAMDALAHRPVDRPADAGVFGRRLRAWLDGERRRDDARLLVERAAAIDQEVCRLRATAAAHAASATAILSVLPPLAPIEQKEAGWALEDQAAQARRRADRLLQERLGLLRDACGLAPEDASAAQLLARHYREAHEAAEAASDHARATELETFLRQYDRGDHRAYLDGLTEVQIEVEPPDATCRLWRYEARARRLQEQPVDGDTRALAPGSYLAVLSHPGHAEVRLPLLVERPGVTRLPGPGRICLPPAQAVDPRDEVLVMAGWFLAGDADARGGVDIGPVWVDTFVIQRFAVTNREYLHFLHDLVAAGREDEALCHAPRERGGPQGPGAMLYAWDGTHFTLAADAEGDVWLPDYPVVNVDWAGARAYAAWKAEKSRQSWRLPAELEWEKAARGVDGRIYPWGDGFDPAWACVRKSHVDTPRPAVVDSFPTDCSPFGMRGAAGNVMEWCLEPYAPGAVAVPADRRLHVAMVDGAAHRVARGGTWISVDNTARVGARYGVGARTRTGNLGFRLVRGLSPGGDPGATTP